MISRKPAFLILFLVCALGAGCAHNYRFKDAPAITEANDTLPSPVPEKTDFNFVEYSVTSSVRYPLVDMLDTRRKPRALDVNSMDEVPASSWFTPRLGSKDLSPEAVLKGPEIKGAPELPITILKAKTEGNSPGFIVKDARGLKYLIKLDRAEYPAIESGANFIVNRIFWALGYNVPEDYIFYFSPETKDLIAGEGVDQDELDKILILSYAQEDGRYRTVASRFLEGEILGPIAQKGTRENDINDKIPHENRRVLRALRMICAWLNNSGMRSDNSLDVYTGEPGKGHTVHYLVDFGEAFGIHGLEKGRVWDGFEYFFSWEDTTRNFFTLGFPVKKWERLETDEDNFLGSFEAELFHPGQWKESAQFLPIRSSLPDDDYWAAKRIAGVTPQQLDALIKAAEYEDQEYAAAIKDVLMKRREKVLRYAFGRVTPVEFSGLENGSLRLKDLGETILNHNGSEYQVEFLNAKSGKIRKNLMLQSKAGEIEIPVEDALRAAKGYLLIRVRVLRDGQPAPRSAQFHIRDSGGSAKLTGVVH